MSCALIGQSVDELETPVLCLDLDRLEANIQQVARECDHAGKGWRPHVKCHKSTEIARRQMAAGAIGMTCARLDEAEAMAGGGVGDILLANYVVGPAKIARLIALRRKSNVMVCMDHVDQLAPLGQAMAGESQPLRVLLEVDIGMRRAGLASCSATIELARRVTATPGLELAGVMGYEGHLLTISDSLKKTDAIRAALDQLVEHRLALEANGMDCRIVSCGGTGSYRYGIEHPGITEVQAGGAVLMDRFYREQCNVSDLQQALTIVATVTGRPAADRAITDAGRKTMDVQIAVPQTVDCAGVEIDYLSAEHGVLRIARDGRQPAVGDRLAFIPGYADFTTYLHSAFVVTRQQQVVAVWPIHGHSRPWP